MEINIVINKWPNYTMVKVYEFHLVFESLVANQKRKYVDKITLYHIHSYYFYIS